MIGGQAEARDAIRKNIENGTVFEDLVANSIDEQEREIRFFEARIPPSPIGFPAHPSAEQISTISGCIVKIDQDFMVIQGLARSLVQSAIRAVL